MRQLDLQNHNIMRSLDNPSCKGANCELLPKSVSFEDSHDLTNQLPCKLKTVIDSDGQVAHSIICQVFFQSACPFLNLFPRTTSQKVLCNKPAGESGYVFMAKNQFLVHKIESKDKRMQHKSQ